MVPIVASHFCKSSANPGRGVATAWPLAAPDCFRVGRDEWTSGVSKKSRLGGQAAAILIAASVGGEKTWQLDRFDVYGGRFRNPLKKSGEEVPREPSRLVVPPMSEVTRILSAIE